MLRITTQIEGDVMTFGLEGKLTRPWVKELERHWRSVVHAKQIYRMRVNVSSVTFIDGEGKDLLRTMYREGVELTATGCLNTCIVDEVIQLENKHGRRFA